MPVCRAMMQALQIAALFLVAAAWAFAFAHAAEMPGKMRLDRRTYLAVQTIYYPGFTIGGASEPLAVVLLAVLLGLTPAESGAFWWTALALAATAATHLVFGHVTQPVNRLWLHEQEMGAAGSAFFATGTAPPGAGWKKLRDRWERSHLVRAALMTLAFVAMTVAVMKS